MEVLSALLLLGCRGEGIRQVTTEQPDEFERHFMQVSEVVGVGVDVPVASAQALRESPREWVPARFTLDDRTWDVEVRLKGHGSFQPFDDRPSFKIRFADDDRFFGLRRLVLNNNASDPSRVRQRLASHALRGLGLPVARAGSAEVFVNGDRRGFYTVAEDVDRQFLRQHYASSGSTLYELFDGDFSEDLIDGLELEEGEPRDDLVNGAIDALSQGPVFGWDAATAYFDDAQFLRFWAAEHAIGQQDAFPYSLPGDDIYLYVDPADDRFDHIAHGLDESFDGEYRALNTMQGLLARRCLSDHDCAARFREHFWETMHMLETEVDLRFEAVTLIDFRRRSGVDNFAAGDDALIRSYLLRRTEIAELDPALEP